MNPILFTAIMWAGQAGAHDGPVGAAAPASYRPAELNGAGVTQKLGTQLPRETPLRDESGMDVTLGQFFAGRPVILVLAYYKCPMLCTQVLNGLFESLPKTGLNPDQYEIVIVSFDPREGPELAAAKRKHYLEAYGRPGLAERVHFLTGSEASINSLTQAVGFGFGYDKRSDQFAHPGMLTLLTPEGRIARYFFGIRFQPRDLRLGLVEASDGKLGTLSDQVVLFCLFYDPNGATYAASVMRVLRLLSGGTVLAIVGYVAVMRMRERRRLLRMTVS
ncbi:MAG: SCO family protein [Gemmataceae bacterium]|nr:SCO family protein [Gemmataceae bacterium]